MLPSPIRIETPALVIREEVALRNIERFQRHCDDNGLKLRPHVKTHKCVHFARAQVAAGATGITCQKIGEAEVMADGGIDDILIAYNILGNGKLGRLRSLAERTKALSVVADNDVVVDGLSKEFETASRPLTVLVECDTGGRRCAGADLYRQNAADYGAQLDELDSWIEEQVTLIPPARRLLVTSHDTFAYFADLYGFEVIGALIPSLAPDVVPSAERLSGLVEVIREHNAPAVFSETTVSGKLPEALAMETGAGLFQLYADSLGEKGTPAGTYLGMVRANVETMVEALK